MLTLSGKLPVSVPADGDALQPGRVYLAPDGMHMGVILALGVLLITYVPALSLGILRLTGHL